MDAFIDKFAWIAIAVIFLVEHLIASSKLKSNSTVELAVNIIKFIFGLDKKKELK